MSVLSRPQGTPERVWSLIGGLEGVGGDLSREDFVSLLNPGYLRGGDQVKAAATLANDAPGVAAALNLYVRDGQRARTSADVHATSLSTFADEVHDTLCRAPSGHLNAVILEAYAWLVVESARRQDIGWLYDVGRETFADMVDNGLVGEDEDGRLMNTTKVVAWRRWLRFLGLGIAMPTPSVDFPSPARRITIEIGRAGLQPGTTLPAEEFLQALASRCPYLDRGRLFVQACERASFNSSQRELSAVLSCGLRDVEADGLISLNLSGDAAGSISLAGDPAALGSSFTSVTILASGAK